MVDYPGENFRNELRKLKREQIKDLYEHTPNQTRSPSIRSRPDVRAVSDPAQRKNKSNGNWPT